MYYVYKWREQNYVERLHLHVNTRFCFLIAYKFSITKYNKQERFLKLILLSRISLCATRSIFSSGPFIDQKISVSVTAGLSW